MLRRGFEELPVRCDHLDTVLDYPGFLYDDCVHHRLTPGKNSQNPLAVVQVNLVRVIPTRPMLLCVMWDNLHYPIISLLLCSAHLKDDLVEPQEELKIQYPQFVNVGLRHAEN